MHLRAPNPYESPNPSAEGEQAAAPIRASARLLSTLANLAILSVQVVLWFMVVIGVGGILYRLGTPYYYCYVEGVDEVSISPGYYYHMTVRPGVFAVVFGAVAWGLGRVRRIVNCRLTK